MHSNCQPTNPILLAPNQQRQTNSATTCTHTHTRQTKSIPYQLLKVQALKVVFAFQDAKLWMCCLLLNKQQTVIAVVQCKDNQPTKQQYNKQTRVSARASGWAKSEQQPNNKHQGSSYHALHEACKVIIAPRWASKCSMTIRHDCLSVAASRSLLLQVPCSLWRLFIRCVHAANANTHAAPNKAVTDGCG